MHLGFHPVKSRKTIMAHKLLPLAVPLPLAGALFKASRPTAYRLNLPVLELSGRKRVAIADLERLLGTKITIEHLAEAQAWLDRSPRASKRLREHQENGEECGMSSVSPLKARDAPRKSKPHV
jgi:hypothetical protein